MQYRSILTLTLPPSIVFLVLSFISVALTTHYWILGDWIIPRGERVTTKDWDDRTKAFKTDYTIIYFKDSETDATIASGCLSLAAAVITIIAWFTLRKPGMDTQFAAGKRRFWVLAVVVMTAASAIAALASLIMHFTKMGDDEYGCKGETLMMNGKFNTNLYCTREMAACHWLKKNLQPKYQPVTTLACNETVVVKWLQLILALNAVVLLAMFSVQARIRRTTRDVKTLDPYTPGGL